MESETCPVPRTELDYCRWRLNIAHQLTYQISLDHYKRSRKFFCARVNRSALASAPGRLYEYNRGVNGLQGVEGQVSVDMGLLSREFPVFFRLQGPRQALSLLFPPDFLGDGTARRFVSAPKAAAVSRLT